MSELRDDVKTGAKWGIVYLFLPQILDALKQAATTVGLLVQIIFVGTEKVGEKAYEVVRRNKMGIFYALLICFVGAAMFFSLGAGFQNRLCMTIGGFFLLTPFMVVAIAGNAVAFLVSIYVNVLGGTLLTVHSALLEALKKAGFEPAGVPKPTIDVDGITKKFRSIWSAIIPLGLTTIYCIVFPSWRALALMPIVIFFLTVMSIMVGQWASIDLATDDKKLIRTARAKRRIYRLVALGLTLLLVWGGFSVAMHSTATALSEASSKTDNEACHYIKQKGSLFGLAKGLVADGYSAATDLIKTAQAHSDSAKQAEQDSLLAYNRRFKTDAEFRNLSIPARSTVTVFNPAGKRVEVHTRETEQSLLGKPFVVEAHDDPVKLYFGDNAEWVIFSGIGCRIQVTQKNKTFEIL